MQFVSPEQFDDARSVDVRSDIYSLAATLYVMLTGAYPFGKGAMSSVLARKLKNEFVPPINIAPEIRPCVDAAIRSGLQADRAQRPASIGDFAALLTTAKKTAAQTPAPTTTKDKPAGKAERERRGGTRYAVELEAACRAVVNVGGKRWPAWIVDISTKGLCLHAQRRFEVGNVLEVSFTLDPDEGPVNLVGRVRWARATPSKSWLLGCELVNAIADDEMNAIVANHMDRTKVQ
jgi:serine/threonine protein kinase